MANSAKIAAWVREIAGLEVNAPVEVTRSVGRANGRRTTIRFWSRGQERVATLADVPERLTWAHLAHALLPLGKSCTERHSAEESA